MALPKARRLRQTTDINRVYSKGRRGSGRFLFIRVHPNGLADSRAVIVVGKKVSKKAVIRNKIRRQISTELAALWPKLIKGQDIVVYVREDSSRNAVEAKKDLTKALGQAGAIKSND